MASATVHQHGSMEESRSDRTKPINRREFLYYLFGGSIAALGVTSVGAAVWYALPNMKRNYHYLSSGELPLRGMAPILYPNGPFWLVWTTDGLLAFDGRCPFVRQPAYYKWVNVTNRFECPACGSKFHPNGIVIEGPTPRFLDRYEVIASLPFGIRKTPPDGGPLQIDEATQIVVNTNRLIRGQPTGEFGLQLG